MLGIKKIGNTLFYYVIYLKMAKFPAFILSKKLKEFVIFDFLTYFLI